MAETAKQSGIALEKAYQFMLWLMATVEKFPRSQKFLLGDGMQGTALDIIEGLVEATYTRNRSPLLELQYRVPSGPHALVLPEPARSRTHRERMRAFRTGHDEQRPGPRLNRAKR